MALTLGHRYINQVVTLNGQIINPLPLWSMAKRYILDPYIYTVGVVTPIGQVSHQSPLHVRCFCMQAKFTGLWH